MAHGRLPEPAVLILRAARAEERGRRGLRRPRNRDHQNYDLHRLPSLTRRPPVGRNQSMFERFTERARQVVVLAQEEARTLKHNYIGTEHILLGLLREEEGLAARVLEDRKSTRLNSSHMSISYAVFCLKKKKKKHNTTKHHET